MKIIALILLFCSKLFFAQNLHVIYSNKNSKFTTFREDLFISKGNVISIRDSIVKNTFDEKDGMSNNQAVFFTKEKLHKIIYYKNTFPKIIIKDYIADNVYFVEDKLPAINWNTNFTETKNISGFICNKATTEFRGSKLTAYYAKDLKFSTGPFKFYGLDGLILEISEDGNTEFNSWIATEVNTDYNGNFKFPNVNDISLISLKEFLEIKEKKREEDFNKIISKAPAGTVITRHKISRNEIEKKYEWE